jgi:hypothetical protein
MVFGKEQLLRVATEVLQETNDANLADLVSELTTHAEYRVSEITRRDLLKALNPLDTLFGDIPLFDGLNLITEHTLNYDALNNEFLFTQSLEHEISQHYMSNNDWSNEDLLINCDALTCSQTRFFALITKLLDPVVRRGVEQAELVDTLNAILKLDRFSVAVVGEQSRRPIYAVQRIAAGVSGSPKNIIFASTNKKPDLIFTDAINNDVAIVNNSDALIYDRPLSASGLLWRTMAEWWQGREKLPDIRSAKRALYSRLLQSVSNSGSIGEIALFTSYYAEFNTLLGDDLPALIPQVYLHFDPHSLRERGHDPVLLRQRMDLLLLLDNNVRVVIEVDGKQHYADGDIASPQRYANMVAEDRRLRLTGYEIYRFGGAEFVDTSVGGGKVSIGPISKAVAVSFFTALLNR